MWTGPENFLFQEALFNQTVDWTDQPRVYYELSPTINVLMTEIDNFDLIPI